MGELNKFLQQNNHMQLVDDTLRNLKALRELVAKVEDGSPDDFCESCKLNASRLRGFIDGVGIQMIELQRRLTELTLMEGPPGPGIENPGRRDLM